MQLPIINEELFQANVSFSPLVTIVNKCQSLGKCPMLSPFTLPSPHSSHNVCTSYSHTHAWGTQCLFVQREGLLCMLLGYWASTTWAEMMQARPAWDRHVAVFPTSFSCRTPFKWQQIMEIHWLVLRVMKIHIIHNQQYFSMAGHFPYQSINHKQLNKGICSLSGWHCHGWYATYFRALWNGWEAPGRCFGIR